MVLPLLCVVLGAASEAQVLKPLDGDMPRLEALYMDLHRAPELSGQEEKTGQKMAEQLKALGFEVTSKVGGHGVVGLLRNGPGPTVMIRADFDGLPVKEETKLPYASSVTAVDSSGATVPVMHACGHDVHMTSWIGAATLLAASKDAWRGTLMMVGQPAEEIGKGAKAMLADGLFKRFPKPDFAVMVHVQGLLPAGSVGLVPGWAYANVDSVDITLYGKGGHGAAPHRTVDPIVLGARLVTALQTIVSREINPLDPAVVTVGSFHAGTKHNIIPPEAKLQLTVRSLKDDVRKKLLAAIERIALAEATAAGAPKPKLVIDQGPPAHFNEPKLLDRLHPVLARALGEANVLPFDPILGGEDFAEYGRAGVPAAFLWIGTADPKAYAAEKKGGAPLVGSHSPFFAPVRLPSLKTGSTVLALSALEFLGKP